MAQMTSLPRRGECKKKGSHTDIEKEEKEEKRRK